MILASLLTLAVWGWFRAPRPVHAVEAVPVLFELRQPDGSTFRARSWGDEWQNGTETVEGYTILRNAQTGRWVYAERNPAGRFVPSNRVVGRDLPVGIPRRVRPRAPEAAIVGKAAKFLPAAQAPPTSATQRILAIVADFTPTQSLGTTEAQWNQFFFAGGGTTTPTSLKNYWDTVSYGTITVQAAAESYGTANNGIVFVTLGYAHPNPAGSTGDANRQITYDALVAADSFVNFASFDTNTDGYLNNDELHIVVVVRGYEASYGGTSACTDKGQVWAHAWSLGFGAVSAPTLDGVVVGDSAGAATSGYRGGYTQTGEWHCHSGDTPGHMATIGTEVHEIGHDLGRLPMPDLYDTDGSSNGVGVWSLQGGGSWNGSGLSGYPGTHPAFPDPWERWFFGFITPTEITTSQSASLPQIETATGANRGVFQLRPNPNGVDWQGTGEYLLVENRQQAGYDAGLPGNGVLIWHIAESAADNADEGSSPPGNRRIVALEQADGRFDLECYANPPYDSLCNNGDSTDPWKVGTETSFDDGTTPNSRLYGGGFSGASVLSISASGTSMSATLDIIAPANTFTFSNAAAITINDNSAATPYPSTISVSGAFGVVAKIAVRLSNFGHTWPSDVDVLLVAPNGANAIIMSDVGGGTSVTGVNLTLDDAAGSPLPDAGPLVSGTFQPTNIGTGDTFPSPAPTPSGNSALSSFLGIDPNGTWSLYVVDGFSGDSGSIAGGWTLEITLATQSSNASSVNIADSGSPPTAAAPYPSNITVSGLSGKVWNLYVKLNGFAHTYPDDVDVLLVAPNGANAIIMSDVGGGVAVTGVNLALSDAAASPLPDEAELVSGTFQPTNIGSGDTFPAPAPAPSGGSALSALSGIDPNGTWSLYLADDSAGDSGSLAGGWTLILDGPLPATGAKKRRGQLISE
jgi:M6 family metalloprotease-like protein